jgi:hypothetical protein
MASIPGRELNNIPKTMLIQRKRALLTALVSLLVVWLLAWGGYALSRHAKLTAEKVMQYQRSLDLARLSPADRIKALKALAAKLNSLSPEERQRWQLDLEWFRELNDEEKSCFIDAFMPGEMQTALRMFEQWPAERQQREIDKALEELRHRAANPRNGAANSGTNPVFSPELDKKIRTMGLNTLYNQGSAQTRAELAPLLMEFQRLVEQGQVNLNSF